MPENNLLEQLLESVSKNKKALFLEKINYRTNHLTIVLENLFQGHNISAVLRSCDVFGLSEVHIIENSNSYKINPEIALGATKWLNIERYNSTDTENTINCIKRLKAKGYKIITTNLNKESYSTENIPIKEKMAIVMGTELKGLSKEAIALADYNVNIPMYGFTESLNVSVATAILLENITKRIRKELATNIWQLSDYEKKNTLSKWCEKVIFKDR